jgi:hypothetical protein
MKLAKFLAIKSEYERFYNDLLSQGRLPLKDTGEGYWAMAVADDVYELFRRLKLQRYKSFIDIGSGDGKVVLIASLFTRATGIEVDDKKLKLISILLHGDYHELDLRAYDLIFYHPDHHNHRLELKLMEELQGKLVVYGGLYHPTSLQREMHFIANTTPVTVFGRKEHAD